MFMTQRWGNGISSGFKFVIFLAVALTILGYMSGNPYLVPNMVNSVVSQFQGHPAEPEVMTTTESAPAQEGTPYKMVVSSPDKEASPVKVTEVESATTEQAAVQPVDVYESDRAHLPEGWRDWSPEKRARYVRALMARIDT